MLINCFGSPKVRLFLLNNLVVTFMTIKNLHKHKEINKCAINIRADGQKTSRSNSNF